MKRSFGLAALLLTCCDAAPENPLGPPLDAIAFFNGRSEGEATLRQIFSAERRVTVDSVGRLQRDGSLILDQMVTIAGKPPRARRWLLRRDGSGRFSGTLTDASGPVEATQVGAGLRINYAMNGGLKVEQWLVPRPGGKALDNRLRVTKLGIRVAALDEVIRKLD